MPDLFDSQSDPELIPRRRRRGGGKRKAASSQKEADEVGDDLQAKAVEVGNKGPSCEDVQDEFPLALSKIRDKAGGTCDTDILSGGTAQRVPAGPFLPMQEAFASGVERELWHSWASCERNKGGSLCMGTGGRLC